MRILVIGGTGSIGPYVVRQLQSAGHGVTVFHSGAHEPELPAQVEHIHCEPWKETAELSGQLPAFRDRFQHLRPDVVLHMVPMAEQDAIPTMQTFRGIAGRVVAVSSIDVYRNYGRFFRTEPGPPDLSPLTEDSPKREKRFPHRETPPRAAEDPRRWLDDYDKILIEAKVMSDAALPGTVVRLPMVYGPGDRGHRLYQYLRRMDLNRPAIILDEVQASWRRASIFVANAAFAIILAATSAQATGRAYHVGEPETPTEAEWVTEIGMAAGWLGTILALPQDKLPNHLKQPFDYRHHYVLDTTRIREELGYEEIVPRQEALRRTIDWERANPPEHFDPHQDEFDAIEIEYLERLLGDDRND